MGNWFRGSTIVTALVAATVGAVVGVTMVSTAGQPQGEQTRPASSA